MTNPQTPSGHWRRQKAKLKLMFPQLTDNDFKYDYGMKDVMIKNLQKKLEKSPSELNELLSVFAEKKSQLKYYNKAAWS